MKFQKITFFSLLFFFLLNCNDSINKRPLIIGHRAAGNIKYGNELTGNSFEAVKYGYDKLDGIEVDIQMSKDSTLWLIHDRKIVNCSGDTVEVCQLTDNEIETISNCRAGSIIKLETLFDFLSKVKEKKFVSLDMKIINNDYCIDQLSRELVREVTTEQIATLYKKYKPNSTIAVESWDLGFLELMELKSPEIETYLLVWNKLEEKDVSFAKKKTIDGLSCNIDYGIDKNSISKANELSIKIQLWTANKEQDINKCLKLNPYTIQTDNVKYFIE